MGAVVVVVAVVAVAQGVEVLDKYLFAHIEGCIWRRVEVVLLHKAEEALRVEDRIRVLAECRNVSVEWPTCLYSEQSCLHFGGKHRLHACKVSYVGFHLWYAHSTVVISDCAM